MRIRSTKPEWPADRLDHRGHFKKIAIPGPVKIEVARRYGAEPGTTTPVACHYCGEERALWWPFTSTGRIGSHMCGDLLEFDHVVPEYRGGSNNASNIVLACRPCNRSKRDKEVSA